MRYSNNNKNIIIIILIILILSADFLLAGVGAKPVQIANICVIAKFEFDGILLKPYLLQRITINSNE